MDSLKSIKVEKQTHLELSVLSPFGIVAEYSSGPYAFFRGDSHYALQICIVLHGEAETMLENFSARYGTGDLWWNMCWEPHAYRLSGKRNFVIAINIDMEQLGACSPFDDCNWLAPFTANPEQRYRPRSDEERAYILDVGRKLFHFYRKRGNNWRISSWLLIHEMLIFAINRMNHPDPDIKLEKSSHNSFMRIRKALNRVWVSNARPPSLAEAAALCSLSTSRFSELFRMSMGGSYGKFAARIRMTNAAKDLLAGHYSIEEIALKWGFFDASHFGHAFKKFYRISPGQFVSHKGSR